VCAGATGILCSHICIPVQKNTDIQHRGLDPEEPVTSSAYLCSFHDLEITAVFIDDLMQQPDQPDAEFMIVYETRSLRDTRDLLKSTTMDNAYAFADTTSHTRLWRILAEHALEQLDFLMADKAYVRCADYQVCMYVCMEWWRV
jgi:WD repeat-containing protein 35